MSRNGQADVIVIGAGPAGANAALVAARAGLSVCLVDEAPAVGGQVWRAPVPGLPEGTDADAIAGAALRRMVADSSVRLLAGHRVWSAVAAERISGGTSGFTVSAVGPEGAVTLTARQLVAATGAHERIVPFPGWTLPGVIGLAAATILLKSHGVAPPGPVVVAGAGPLLFAVAAKLVASGNAPAAVVDLDGRLDWAMRLPALARVPSELARGLRWQRAILASGVAVHHRATVARATGDRVLKGVEITPVDRTGAALGGQLARLAAGTLVIGHGLSPGAEVAALLGARRHNDPTLGGMAVVADDAGRTSVPGLYAIGDGAGVRGAAVAEAMGELCGAAVVEAAGRGAPATGAARRRLARRLGFSRAIGGALRLRHGQVSAVPGDTVVCRCEDVTRAEIDAAADAGAADVNQLKHFTRAGMGPCQGRMCGEVVAALLASRRGVTREAVGVWTPRPPLRPVTLDDLVGDFTYADIPIPAPAPL